MNRETMGGMSLKYLCGEESAIATGVENIQAMIPVEVGTVPTKKSS